MTSEPVTTESSTTGTHERPEPGSAPGLVRRIRRTADLSQRDLAARIGVPQSTVARWETGRASPSLADLERVAALAGLTVALLDPAGDPVSPMRGDAARDRGGRRFPAHVDLSARGWWQPPGSHLTATGFREWQRSVERGDVRIAYDRAMWREIFRGINGVPDDHPTRADLLATQRAETEGAETAAASRQRPD